MEISVYKIERIQPLRETNFIKPVAIHYSKNDIEARWEAVLTHDSVAVLLYNTDRDSFILVKQMRPAVLNKNPKNGMMYELCAGIVDKKKSNIEIAKEEILEECGYDVPLENLQKISSFYTSVGISGTHQTIYYAECDDSMIVNGGGGLEEEDIEVVYIPLERAREFMFDESYQKTTGILMTFYWFFDTFKRTL